MIRLRSRPPLPSRITLRPSAVQPIHARRLLCAVGLFAGQACGGEPNSPFTRQTNEGSFTATTSGMIDTAYSGNAYFTALSVGATLTLEAESRDSLPRLSISGPLSAFTVGEHEFSQDLWATYSGHGEEFVWSFDGTLTVTERDGRWIRGTVVARAPTLQGTGADLYYDTVTVHATFESTGIVVP